MARPRSSDPRNERVTAYLTAGTKQRLAAAAAADQRPIASAIQVAIIRYVESVEATNGPVDHHA